MQRLFIGGGGAIRPYDLDLATGAITPTAPLVLVDGAGVSDVLCTPGRPRPVPSQLDD